MQRRMNKHFIVDWENWSSNERRGKQKGMILGHGERGEAVGGWWVRLSEWICGEVLRRRQRAQRPKKQRPEQAWH